MNSGQANIVDKRRKKHGTVPFIDNWPRIHRFILTLKRQKFSYTVTEVFPLGEYDSHRWRITWP